MDIFKAIEDLEDLVEYGSNENVSQYYLGEYTWDVFEALECILAFLKRAKQLAEVPAEKDCE